jgi:hypothetical protein
MVIRTVARYASSPMSGDWNLAPWTRFCLTKYPMLVRKPRQICILLRTQLTLTARLSRGRRAPSLSG